MHRPCVICPFVLRDGKYGDTGSRGAIRGLQRRCSHLVRSIAMATSKSTHVVPLQLCPPSSITRRSTFSLRLVRPFPGFGPALRLPLPCFALEVPDPLARRERPRLTEQRRPVNGKGLPQLQSGFRHTNVCADKMEYSPPRRCPRSCGAPAIAAFGVAPPLCIACLQLYRGGFWMVRMGGWDAVRVRGDG